MICKTSGTPVESPLQKPIQNKKHIVYIYIAHILTFLVQGRVGAAARVVGRKVVAGTHDALIWGRGDALL